MKRILIDAERLLAGRTEAATEIAAVLARGDQIAYRMRCGADWSRGGEAPPVVQAARLTAGLEPPSLATPEDLAAINAMPQVQIPHTPETVYVRCCYCINDQLMHNGFQIETAGMGKIASLARGVPVMANHDTYSSAALPAARLFGGEEVRAGGSTWADVKAWFVRNAKGTDAVSSMDGGGISEASVQIAFKTLECSICNTDMYKCAHIPLQSYDGKMAIGLVRSVTEFLELSMVWAGMAKGTAWHLPAPANGKAQRGPMARYFRERARGSSSPNLGRLFVKH